MQGDYLLNNVIGFHGVLDYRVQDDGSGFKADPVEPLLQAGDTNFRPVDLEFGPDGALYLCDWFNPLIGHMQHSVRDPQAGHDARPHLAGLEHEEAARRDAEVPAPPRFPRCSIMLTGV